MKNPKTKAEAAKMRYGAHGFAYQGTQCAAEVADGGRSVSFHQCRRKPGYGPDGLYCKQHAASFA